MNYRCPSCGCTELPPAVRKAVAEFEALDPVARSVAYTLIWNREIHGHPKVRAWSNAWSDCMKMLVPSFWDAEETGDPGRVIMDNADPENAEELPEAWTPEATA